MQMCAGADGVGKVNFATSAFLILAANTVTATATRGSASARPIGVASSAIKVLTVLFHHRLFRITHPSPFFFFVIRNFLTSVTTLTDYFK